jgi:phage shock protein PspC (stress-responsive transcriptional regulator)
MASTELVRPRRGRLVGGVCAGLARRFGVSPLAVRVVFLLSMLVVALADRLSEDGEAPEHARSRKTS